MKKLVLDDQIKISKQIEELLEQYKNTLHKAKLGIYEKMTEYKLIDFPLSQTVFPKLNGEDEKQIFQQLYVWQKEIHKMIRILHQVNRNLHVPDEEEGAASQLVRSSDDEK